MQLAARGTTSRGGMITAPSVTQCVVAGGSLTRSAFRIKNMAHASRIGSKARLEQAGRIEFGWSMWRRKVAILPVHECKCTNSRSLSFHPSNRDRCERHSDRSVVRPSGWVSDVFVPREKRLSVEFPQANLLRLDLPFCPEGKKDGRWDVRLPAKLSPSVASVSR